MREDAETRVVGSRRRESLECVKCDGRLWTTIASTMGCGNIACTSSHPTNGYTSRHPDVRDVPLFSSTSTPSTEDPTGLPRRNMLARTSDTLGFAVCRAVPITPRRIPSACYLSLGTRAGDIMWESRRIRRYARRTPNGSATNPGESSRQIRSACR